MTNDVMVKEYLDWLEGRGRVGITLYNYTACLDRYLAHVRTTRLGDVTLPEMESFILRPRRSRKPGAAATQSKDVAILHSLYKYLHERGHLDRNNAALLRGPKVNNHNPKPIPDHDWVALWTSVADDATMQVALGLGFFGGLRRREIIELRVDQVFAGADQLVGFKRKGGGDDVLHYGLLCEILGPQLHADGFPALLAAHVAQRPAEGFVLDWGDRLPAAPRERWIHGLPEGTTDPNTLNRLMGKACVGAGLKSYTPHMLRHSFVTNLLRRDVPLHLVQRMANHSDPVITARYMKAGASELREWIVNHGTP